MFLLNLNGNKCTTEPHEEAQRYTKLNFKGDMYGLMHTP